VPTVLVWLPGFATATVLLEFTVQVNWALPEAPVVSVAVTMTEDVPAVVGVPLIRPLELLIESPGGNPLAE
jgi:hypothetical protein